MTDYYVSTSGDNSDGLTWAKAKTGFAAGLALCAAGDTLYVDSTHAETGVSVGLTYSGLAATPMRIISATNGTTTYAAGATITHTTGTVTWNTNTSVIAMYGMTINVVGDWNLYTPGLFRACTFNITGSAHYLRLPKKKRLESCVFYFDTSNQSLDVGSFAADYQACELSLVGCSMAASSANTVFLRAQGGDSYIRIEDTDLSAMPSGSAVIHPVSGTTARGTWMRLSGVRLPTSGVVIAAAHTKHTTRVEAYSCGPAGSAVVDLDVSDIRGRAIDNTTVYRTATYDGSTGYSIQITPTTSSSYSFPFRVQIFERYCEANPTLTVHLVHDGSSDLQDDEAWLEIEAPDGTNPVGRNISFTRATDIGTASSSLTTGSSTGWTTTGLSTPVYDEIEAAVTGGAGVYRVTLCVALGAATPVLYVDPRAVIS